MSGFLGMALANAMWALVRKTGSLSEGKRLLRERAVDQRTAETGRAAASGIGFGFVFVVTFVSVSVETATAGSALLSAEFVFLLSCTWRFNSRVP